MYIFESEDSPNQTVLREQRVALKSALPHLNFGGDYSGRKSKTNIRVQVFPNFNVAVVNDLEDASTVSKLRELGYRVPERRSHIGEGHVYELADGTDDDYVRVGESGRNVTPHEILWEELKAGFGHDSIRKNLSSLLYPIISQPDVKAYEFAVYQHYSAGSDDIEGYVKYTDIFRLAHDAVVDALLDKLRLTDPHDVLAISSRVLTDNGDMHIPMIDFKNDVDVEEMLRRIDVSNHMLVYSGNSYHHYDTTRLLTQAEFEAYMHLLAEQPEVGDVWPSLQLEQGFSLLRIAPSASKLFYPEIVEE